MKFLFSVILSTGAFRICWQLNVYNEILIIEIGIVSEFKETIERQKFCEESGKSDWINLRFFSLITKLGLI